MLLLTIVMIQVMIGKLIIRMVYKLSLKYPNLNLQPVAGLQRTDNRVTKFEEIAQIKAKLNLNIEFTERNSLDPIS